MNTHNIYEFIYIIIGSSISHAVVVLYIIYVIFDKFIIEENEKNIADKLIEYLAVYKQVIKNKVKKAYPDIDKYISDDFFNSSINLHLPPLEGNIKEKSKNVDQQNNTHNILYYDRAIIIIIILAIICLFFVLMYYTKFRNYIKLIPSLSEMLISLLIATIIISIYQFAFVFYFVFNYVDYHFDNYFINKIKYPDGTKIYDYYPSPSPSPSK